MIDYDREAARLHRVHCPGCSEYGGHVGVSGKTAQGAAVQTEVEQRYDDPQQNAGSIPATSTIDDWENEGGR